MGADKVTSFCLKRMYLVNFVYTKSIWERLFMEIIIVEKIYTGLGTSRQR